MKCPNCKTAIISEQANKVYKEINGNKTVGEIANKLNMSPPLVSYHINVLLEHDLIEAKVNKKSIRYDKK